MKQKLKDEHLTQEKFSKIAGIGIETIRICSKGESVCEKTAIKICNALDLDFKKSFQPVGDGKLSNKTIHDHYTFISSVLNTAYRWEMISKNPCDLVKPPKVPVGNPTFLDLEETQRLLTCLEKEDLLHYTMIYLLIQLGLRRGELLGLKWEDIKFDKNLIDINKSMTMIGGVATVKEPKTKGSARIIKVSDSVMELLQEWKIEQKRLKMITGDRWIETGFVFTRIDGQPFNPDTLTAWFKKLLRKNNFDDSLHIHSLRHTNATLLIESKQVPLTAVASRLGHADTNTTLKVYAHTIKETDAMCAEVVDDILTKLKEA